MSHLNMEKKMLDKCDYENFATENSVITITTLMGKVFKNCVVMRSVISSHHEIILPDNTKHKISFDELSQRGNLYLFFDYMDMKGKDDLELRNLCPDFKVAQ